MEWFLTTFLFLRMFERPLLSSQVPNNFSGWKFLFIFIETNNTILILLSLWCFCQDHSAFYPVRKNIGIYLNKVTPVALPWMGSKFLLLDSIRMKRYLWFALPSILSPPFWLVIYYQLGCCFEGSRFLLRYVLFTILFHD